MKLAASSDADATAVAVEITPAVAASALSAVAVAVAAVAVAVPSACCGIGIGSMPILLFSRLTAVAFLFEVPTFVEVVYWQWQLLLRRLPLQCPQLAVEHRYWLNAGSNFFKVDCCCIHLRRTNLC